VCQTCPDAQRALRVLGVFVSSTFPDMQAERDKLIKHVALTLPAACERRGVSFGFVDLRWGITEEGSNRGEAYQCAWPRSKDSVTFGVIERRFL
jgi:hypothetical protein